MAGLNCLDCCPAYNAALETQHHFKKADNNNFTTSMTTEINNTTTTTNNISRRRRPLLEPTAWKTHVNPYHVLELRKDATPSEIVLSYRKLSLFHHPGRKSKIVCPLERKRRIEYFEMLAACYETLMHNEFRRRYDVLLKDIEKKQQNTTTNGSNNDNSCNSNDNYYTLNRQQPRLKHTSYHGVDSIPGLIPCSSQSSCFEVDSFPTKGGSDDTIPTTNCNSMMLICASPSSCGDGVSNKNKYTNSKNNNNFTISRDGTKGFRSLVDSVSVSASQSQASAEEEAEIHFSEATVNRLFGGPLASLHRARNFKAFSDPNEVFNKVFGNVPIFSSVKIGEINAAMTTSEDMISNELIRIYEDENSSNKISTQSSMLSQWNYAKLDDYSPHNNDNNNDDKPNDQKQTTKVFVSSRVIHGRKITKTEIIHVDPQTSMASVNVTVDGEYLDISKSEKKSSSRSSGVGDWLLCFGTSTAKVSPLSCPSTMKNNCYINNPCRRTATNNNVSGGNNVCEGFKSIYIEVLEEFYLCNRKFYEECNRYMSCGGDL